MIRKISLLLIFGLVCVCKMYSQTNSNSSQMTDEEIEKDILGIWTRQLLNESGNLFSGTLSGEVWIFNADGTKTVKKTVDNTIDMIGGYEVKFNYDLNNVEEKWIIKNGDIQYTYLPLKTISLKVKPKLSNFDAGEKKEIRAAIPNYEKISIRNFQLLREGHINEQGIWHIKSYSKNKMIIQDGSKELIFLRDAKTYVDSKITQKTGTINGHDYVDLGLPSGTVWATCNVGALTPNQNGSFFAFGEITSKQNYSEGTYKYYFKQSGKYQLKKYCSSLKYTTSYDYVDGKEKLDLNDDVAHVKWGKDWRMPSKDELEELSNKCVWEHLNDGVIVTGPNGNSIFLPAAGWMYGNEHIKGNNKGCYITNCVTETAGVWGLNFEDKEVDSMNMYLGYSIRPVNSSMAEELRKKMQDVPVQQVKDAPVQQAQETEILHYREDSKIYDVVEDMPQFPGGPSAMFEYLSNNIKYPVVAEENGVQGRVIVTIVVECDGSITDVKVVKSVDPSLDKEAQRIVRSMPHWIPGKQNGKPVRVKYTVPVTFRL